MEWPNTPAWPPTAREANAAKLLALEVLEGLETDGVVIFNSMMRARPGDGIAPLSIKSCYRTGSAELSIALC